MEILNQQEVEQVSGGRISIAEGVGATIALMSLCAASPVVITVGGLALLGYGALSLL